MFNLAEILTIIMGFLIAVIFMDGVRRALRAKDSKLKVEIQTSTDKADAELNENFNFESSNESLSHEKVDETAGIEILSISEPKLLIINISSDNQEPFSYSSLLEQINSFKFSFEEKGFFTFRNLDDSIMFSLLNAKTPGTFENSISSSDIALVLDSSKTENLVEAFDQMCSLSTLLSQSFSCSLLDENRNILTKQMLEHMRNKTQEYQRQQLAKVG